MVAAVVVVVAIVVVEGDGDGDWGVAGMSIATAMALGPLAEPGRQSRRVEPGVAHALGGVRRRLEAYGICADDGGGAQPTHRHRHQHRHGGNAGGGGEGGSEDEGERFNQHCVAVASGGRTNEHVLKKLCASASAAVRRSW